jgi:hypothetical protein
MPKGIRQPLQELEGGKGFGGMGGSGGGGGRGLGLTQQAVRNAEKNKTNVGDELFKLDRQLAIKKEVEAAKAKPGRQAAEREASVTQEGGVKKTVYPYAGANEYKKGGMTASSRADGIAQRGKTRGKMV